MFLDRGMIRRVIRRSGLFVVAPIELRLTEHLQYSPLEPRPRNTNSFRITYRLRHPLDGAFATVISFVLSREDKKILFDESPDLDRVVERLASSAAREPAPRAPWQWY
jgi:hypothetical protein